MRAVQSTTPSYNRDGLPIFSDPRVVENLYNSQNRILHNTSHLANHNGFQIDQMCQEFLAMSADLSVLRGIFRHFFNQHYLPLQDIILPTTARAFKAPCECPAPTLTRDFSVSSPDYIFQVRTDDSSICSPLLRAQTVSNQSPLSYGPGSPPPLDSVTHSSVHSSIHSPTPSIPLPVPPPQDYQTAHSSWYSDSDSELSEETSLDGNPDDAEEVGEELWEGFGTQGIRRGSV
jgi:hypothetical protein